MKRFLKIGGIGCGIVIGLAVCGLIASAMFTSSKKQTTSIAEAPTQIVSQTDAPLRESESDVETTAEPVKTEEPTSTPVPVVPVIAKVGERMESEGIALTVLQVQKITSAGLTTAEEGNILVDIEVILENTDRDEAPYNPMYFKLKDSNNYEYESNLFGSLEPSLQSGDLKKGEIARGHVTFEVPEDAYGLVVSYEPIVLLGGYEPLRVDLEQMTEQPITALEGDSVVPDGKVGERLESAGVAIIILKVEKTKKIDYATADAGNIFVDLEVVIQNAGREDTTPFNPLYFKLKDSNGYEYNTSFIGLFPSLQSGELDHGDMVRGHVAFETPEQVQGLIVSFEPEVLFGGYEPIKIELDAQVEQTAEIPHPLTLPAYTLSTPMESAGISLTILNVQVGKNAGGMSAQSGREYLDIEVEIKNVSRSEDTPYNPLYFKVKDSNGYEYSASFTSLEPSLQSGELPMGESVRGHVAFEIPENVTGLVVSYVPEVLFGGYRIIRVSLIP